MAEFPKRLYRIRRLIVERLLEPISKMHLTLNSCVTDLLKMLTYYCVCCAFSSAAALLSTFN